MNLPVSKISEHEETYSTSLFSMLLPLGSDSIAKQDEIYNVQKEVIREMAEKESCIIVGRCADYIFRDHRNVLNIYIYSPNLRCTISASTSAVPLTPSMLESIMICLLSRSPGAYFAYRL